jgi:biotin carboxylase
MPRVLLLVPTSTYRTSDFLAAAAGLGLEIVVGAERRNALESVAPGGTVRVDLDDIGRGTATIVDLAAERPLDAVVGVDDGSTLVAAAGAAALGLAHNPVEAVEATHDKSRMRELFAAAGLPTPKHRLWPADADPRVVALERARDGGFPCVVKPIDLSASRGVIRADDETSLAVAFERVAGIVRAPDLCGPGGAAQPILVEDFIPGREVALEGLLRGGRLETLAIFDKPDPLDGPTFEETIYVTPSRLPPEEQAAVRDTVARAASALGLREGPIHAEVRLRDGEAWPLEIASRSIGGLCARTLRFGAGVSLEELILRHAVGLPLPDAWLRRERGASGVMMLPIRRRGRLVEVRGQDEARAVPGVVGLSITIPRGGELVPLPEGDRYLGFLFARADDPARVEAALREAHARLDVVVDEG